MIPNQHAENIFDLPKDLAGKNYQVAPIIALGMKAIDSCDRISTRQPNESVGNQDAWHDHRHIFPRYIDDH
jgi:histidine triad (HIT) family protein